MGAAGAAVGAVTGVVGGLISGQATQRAANQQADAARVQLASDQYGRSQAQSFAAPSFDEMQQIHKQLDYQSQLYDRHIESLKQEQALINSIDPSIMAASQNAKDLLSGKSSALLAPIQQERQNQRNQLENQLRDQLGSGYQTSSAGQEALNRFDQQTSGLMANAQQSALGSVGQYLGVASQSRPNMIGLSNAAFGAVSDMSQRTLGNYNQFATRQIAAIEGTPINFNNSIRTAGNSNVGQAMLGNTFSQLGGSVLGYSAGGGSGGGGDGGGGFESVSGSADNFKMPAMGSSAGFGR